MFNIFGSTPNQYKQHFQHTNQKVMSLVQYELANNDMQFHCKSNNTELTTCF